jgi:hypothetical protein
VYDTLGLWRALWLSPRWQIRKEYLVLSKDLSTLETQRLPTDAQVPARWTILTDADIPALRVSNPLLSEAEMRRRWQEGQECTGAWMDQLLAHYRWETDKRCYLPYLKKTFEPRAGDILISDAFTHRAFRRHGIHSQSTARSLIRARELGLRRSITMVAWWNVAARRVVLEKARRDVVGHVGYWQFGIATRHFATGKVRFDGAGDVYVAHG